MVLCPMVPVAAEHTLAFVLQIVTYTFFSLNFCILTTSQLLYAHSNALGEGGEKGPVLMGVELNF